QVPWVFIPANAASGASGRYDPANGELPAQTGVAARSSKTVLLKLAPQPSKDDSGTSVPSGATRSMVRSLSRGYVMLSCTFRLLMGRFWGMSMEEVVKTSGKSTGCGTSVALNVTLRRSRFSRTSRDGRKGAGRPGRHTARCRRERACGPTRRDRFDF